MVAVLTKCRAREAKCAGEKSTTFRVVCQISAYNALIEHLTWRCSKLHNNKMDRYPKERRAAQLLMQRGVASLAEIAHLASVSRGLVDQWARMAKLDPKKITRNYQNARIMLLRREWRDCLDEADGQARLRKTQ